MSIIVAYNIYMCIISYMKTEKQIKRAKYMAEYMKEYYAKNKEKWPAYGKKYRDNNKEITAKRHKIYQEENKEALKEYRDKNKDRISDRSKKYHDENRSHIAERAKIYGESYRKKRKDDVSDTYVRSLITNSTTLKAKDIPQELIELKRVEIKLKRGIKDVKENNEND